MKQKPIIINVLTADTFEDCHIPGSINVPIDELPQKLSQWAKDTHIVVYCASSECPLSKRAWHIFHDAGFTQVYELIGGLRDWVEAGYPAVGDCTAHYLRPPFGQPLPEDPETVTITVQELKKLF